MCLQDTGPSEIMRNYDIIWNHPILWKSKETVLDVLNIVTLYSFIVTPLNAFEITKLAPIDSKKTRWNRVKAYHSCSISGLRLYRAVDEVTVPFHKLNSAIQELLRPFNNTNIKSEWNNYTSSCSKFMFHVILPVQINLKQFLTIFILSWFFLILP